ncbi:hypothetical protein MC885_016954 [Smutsia gigantea]|nr:hypothetical protein MC885_016954 [Smutsia gigantea]
MDREVVWGLPFEKGTWVSSLSMGMIFFCSPVVSIFTDIYGCRKTAVVGAAVGFTGLLSSSFVSDAMCQLPVLGPGLQASSVGAPALADGITSQLWCREGCGRGNRGTHCPVRKGSSSNPGSYQCLCVLLAHVTAVLGTDTTLPQLSGVGSLTHDSCYLARSGKQGTVGLQPLGQRTLHSCWSKCPDRPGDNTQLRLLSAELSSSIEPLYLTYGIIFACGCSFAYQPSLVVLGQYFKKRLGLVNGIVTAGSSVFTILLPFLLRVLTDSVGLSYTLRVLCVFMFVLFLAGFTYRPLAPSAKEEESAALGGDRLSLFSRRKLSPPRRLFNFAVFKVTAYAVWAAGVPLALFGYFVPYVHLVSALPGLAGNGRYHSAWGDSLEEQGAERAAGLATVGEEGTRALYLESLGVCRGQRHRRLDGWSYRVAAENLKEWDGDAGATARPQVCVALVEHRPQALPVRPLRYWQRLSDVFTKSHRTITADVSVVRSSAPRAQEVALLTMLLMPSAGIWAQGQDCRPPGREGAAYDQPQGPGPKSSLPCQFPSVLSAQPWACRAAWRGPRRRGVCSDVLKCPQTFSLKGASGPGMGITWCYAQQERSRISLVCTSLQSSMSAAGWHPGQRALARRWSCTSGRACRDLPLEAMRPFTALATLREP